MQQSASFQMRVKDGRHYVYMIRFNGKDIPRDRQRAIFGPETQARAQVISDSLNRGLLTKITLAVQAEQIKENG